MNTKVLCNAGMGDIIHTINVLTHFKTYKFNLYPRLSLCDIYCEGRGKVFAYNVAEYFCRGSNIELKCSADSKFVHPGTLIDLAKECGLKIQYPAAFLANKITEMKDFEDKVVITTKARGCGIQQIKKILFQVIPYLQTLTSNVVIMGVHEYPKSYEYSISHLSMISIYQQLKEFLPEALDMTRPTLDNFGSNIQDFIYDLSIMKSAKKILTFGQGGNTVMGQFNTNCISYATHQGGMLWEQVFYDNKLTYTIEKFIKSFNEWKLI